MRLRNKSLIGLLFLLTLLASSSLEAASITTTVCPGVGCVNYNVAGQGSIGIQITGTWVGTITFQSTLDNSTYTSFRVVSAADTASSGVLTSTGNGIWNGTVAGISQIRVVFTAWTSGTAVVSVRINNQAVKFNGGGGGGSSFDCSMTSDTQVLINIMGACAGDNQFEYNPGVGFSVAVGASMGVSPDVVSMQSKSSVLGQAYLSLTSGTFPTPGTIVARGNTSITGTLSTTSTINGLTVNSSNSADTQVLFNNSGVVAGDSGLTYSSLGLIVRYGSDVNAARITSSVSDNGGGNSNSILRIFGSSGGGGNAQLNITNLSAAGTASNMDGRGQIQQFTETGVDAIQLWDDAGNTLRTTINASGMTLSNGLAIRSDTTVADAVLFQAYDVDGTAYKTACTLTSGNAPSFSCSPSGDLTVSIQGTYKSNDGSTGVTVTSCTSFKNGICVAGT